MVQRRSDTDSSAQLTRISGPPFVNRIASVVKKVDPNEIKRGYGITTESIMYDPPLSKGEQLAMISIPSEDSSKCEIIIQKDPPRLLTNLSLVPVLVVTSESGYHAYYDHSTVAFLRQAGVTVSWLNLPEVNVRGNGHFMFLEKNSDEIARHLYKWLENLEKS